MDPVTTTPRIWRIPVPVGPIPVVIPFRADGPHYYIQKTWVGSASQGATTEAAFAALRHFATPFQGGVRINDTLPGEERQVTNIAGFGPVEHYVLADQKTIVNTTKPRHILDPGNVFRKIVQEGDDIYVVTEGYGQGIFPTFTKLSAPRSDIRERPLERFPDFAALNPGYALGAATQKRSRNAAFGNRVDGDCLTTTCRS